MWLHATELVRAIFFFPVPGATNREILALGTTISHTWSNFFDLFEQVTPCITAVK